MNPPSLQSVLPPPGSQREATSQSGGLVVSRLFGSRAGQVQTLENYSFVITPRVVASFTTLVGKKKILTQPSQGRLLLTYPPFETLVSSPADRERGIDNTEPYYVVLANAGRLRILASELYGRSSLSLPLAPRPFNDPMPFLMDRFIAESESEREEKEVILESLSALIMVDLLRSSLALEPPSPTRYPGIKKALRCIRTNFDSEVTVPYLAGIAGLSLQHFIVVFRDTTGYTPHAYLRAIRLQAAAQLLRQGWDVTRTCYRVGFRSLSGFEHAFTRFHGVLPKIYQRHF